jgi:glycosyltransferase involved in cell wall biosynthesis
MYRGHRVGVVVPVYNEADFVGDVIDSLPEYVDRAYVVDDCSTDGTWAVIQRRATTERAVPTGAPDGGTVSGPVVHPIRHETNQGRGGAVKTGYRAALADGMDVVAAMDGDGQMDPEELDRLLDPVVTGRVDYAKGDRIGRRPDRAEMSAWRVFGNTALTGLTRVASGYWGMNDAQNGYTAISAETLDALDLDAVYDDYGFLNDVLVWLNVHDARIADVSMRARYGDEESGIQYRTFVPKLSVLLVRGFVRRVRASSGGRLDSPLAPLYALAALVAVTGSLAAGVALGTAIAYSPASVATVTLATTVALFVAALLVDRSVNRRLVSRFGLDGLE